MKKQNFPQLLFADEKGKIYPFAGLEAAGMKAGYFFRPDKADFLKVPAFSELFMLPDRLPAGFDPATGGVRALDRDPYVRHQKKCFAVAAFVPPGHTITQSAAYRQLPGAKPLPLFSYAACFLYKNEIYASALCVDKDRRHDESCIDPREVAARIRSVKKLFPKNRLVPHLADCVIANACANAKNFFLGRHEAPLPTSPACNARCRGCISFQPSEREFSSSHERIRFVPAPEEIAEIALFHMERTRDAIVSFGQGCEGEPLLSAAVIEKAIRVIRHKTSKGSIHMNTNASCPDALQKLLGAGLNSIRVSLNSARERYYSLYYQPRGYTFQDVLKSISLTKKQGGFVSINYLSMPGFTDSPEEVDALAALIGEYRVDMIQWRNLNYDPLGYFRDLNLLSAPALFLGMRRVMETLKKEFPKLKMGCFNPASLRAKRSNPLAHGRKQT